MHEQEAITLNFCNERHSKLLRYYDEQEKEIVEVKAKFNKIIILLFGNLLGVVVILAVQLSVHLAK